MIDTTAITSGTTASARGEHEQQHDQRAEAADHRLGEQAGTVVVAAALVGERVEAGHVDGRAADGHVLQRVARLPRRLGVGAEVVAVGARRVDERVDGVAVTGDECAVARRGIGRDASTGERLLERRVDLREVGLHAGRLDGLAGRERDHRQQRHRVAAGACIALGDLGVGDRPLLVGDRELERERARRRPRRGNSGDGHGDPEDDDEALVGEDPAGEGGHAAEPPARPAAAYRECPSGVPQMSPRAS